ncbi:MAG TPA: DNA methyltransferase [Bacteroidales bacterium]|nr:MAG: DNA methylase [Bacteroidetes bacterium ADurb.Bin041]HNV50714.1 DNA methyltransferase [Bacteroidales bacterium]HPW43835.1 DNA methyltransferase [Bacteroidales bacterium]HQF02113.1 DNA methyltransferase [Bacteroidales bacterium]HQH15328.1 DNA methyltransferase [Bacteroidales bacterium]
MEEKTKKADQQNSNKLEFNLDCTPTIDKVSEPKVLNYNLKKRTNKRVDESWDFRNANTKEFTHCFHSYPAMMIPQVARRIINTYGSNAKMLFDPYCGTGTSLVEACLAGKNAIGTDINPLARLIATTKTTKLDIQVLDLFFHDFMDYFFALNFQDDGIKSMIIPEVKNIDFWFSKSVQRKLGILLGYIENINDISIRNFFKVAFSETVREVSYQKPGEFKLIRRKDFDKRVEPDVIGIMISKLTRNRRGLIDFVKSYDNNSSISIYDFNTVENIPINILKDESVDIVVTSPPYGDSRTTVAYGQYSRLSNQWLGFLQANQIDNKLMGGKKSKQLYEFKCDFLNGVIYAVQKQDSERVRDVVSFYKDYEKSIGLVSRTLKKGGFVCYVVGNRTVKGIKIPTDEITTKLFEQNNFTHIETIVRNIPNKRMPSKNSPSNIAGKTASTMKNEYIVICQKK